MIRFAWGGMQGPRIRPDGWWRAALAAGGLLWLLQAVALAVAALTFLGRASERCLSQPVCDLTQSMGDFAALFVSLAAISLSIGILGTLTKVLRALWTRNGWSALAARFIGIAVFVGGLLLVWTWGIYWLIAGLFLWQTAKRLRYEEPGAPAHGSRGAPDSGYVGDDTVIDGERI